MADQLVGLFNNSFERNIRSSFQHLRKTTGLCDLTIFCETKTFLAHKVVMAASSSYFTKILSTTSHPNPLIVMDDVPADFMDTVLDFVYCGEVMIESKNLESFLTLCKRLKIEGLCGDEDEDTNKRGICTINSTDPLHDLQESEETDSPNVKMEKNTETKDTDFDIYSMPLETSSSNSDTIHHVSSTLKFLKKEELPHRESFITNEETMETLTSTQQMNDNNKKPAKSNNIETVSESYKSEHNLNEQFREENINNVTYVFEGNSLFINGHQYLRRHRLRDTECKIGSTKWTCHHQKKKNGTRCPVSAITAFRVRGELEPRRIEHEDPNEYPDKYEQVLMRCQPLDLHLLYHNDDDKGKQLVKRARFMIRTTLEEDFNITREQLGLKIRNMFSDKLVAEGQAEDVELFQDAWDHQAGLDGFVTRTMKDIEMKSGEMMREAVRRREEKVERERQFLEGMASLKK